MPASTYYFPDVTLLITHYNRSQSLERLLKRFSELQCQFGDIVVSDDGSKAEHLQYLTALQEQYSFQLKTTPVNKGLGNNINKGQDAINSLLTLYVQEDFIPLAEFPGNFKVACELLAENKGLDIVRFYAYFRYPYLKPVHRGFSEMKFNLWLKGYRKFYYYSDHPHLRRSDFLKKFGRYAEGCNPEQTEYRMMMAFLKKRGKALFFEDYQSLFEQVNSSAEPSTMKRNSMRRSDIVIIKAMRNLYRHVKFNLNYLTN